MKAIALVMAGLTAATFVQSASAANWTMTYNGLGLNETVGIRFRNLESWDSATAASGFDGVEAGQHNFTVYGKTYSNYCVQLFEGLVEGETNVWCTAALADVPDGPPAPGPMGAIKAVLIQDLYARFHQSVKDSGNSVQHAAFNVVLWEITHESLAAADADAALAQLSLVNGALQLDGAKVSVLNAANAMLALLGDGGFKSLGDNLFGLTHPTRQDHLVVVPIPAAAMLAGVGLLGAGLLRRRFTK
jgi:hypothetical protein